MVDEEPLCGYDKLPLNRVLILMYYLFIYPFIAREIDMLQTYISLLE